MVTSHKYTLRKSVQNESKFVINWKFAPRKHSSRLNFSLSSKISQTIPFQIGNNSPQRFRSVTQREKSRYRPLRDATSKRERPAERLALISKFVCRDAPATSVSNVFGGVDANRKFTFTRLEGGAFFFFISFFTRIHSHATSVRRVRYF